mgnify:CR=1 FL=1
MTPQSLKELIEESLKFRKEYQNEDGTFPIKEIELRAGLNTLRWVLWGGEIIFYDLDDAGGGKFYFNDTSGG